VSHRRQTTHAHPARRPTTNIHPQGAALFLLERYSDAETACLEGLALSPGNAALTEGLGKAQAVLAEQQRAGDDAAAGSAGGAGEAGRGGGSKRWVGWRG